MHIDWALIVEAIKALAWPVFAAATVFYLRGPLVDLVGQLARRATRLSVFDVSVELATLPELRTAWQVGDADPRRLTSSMIFDSASQALFAELAKPQRADYAIVDLQSGKAWLTSRLFIFSLILGEVTGVRAFVFLESTANTRRKFLGVATAVDVRRALGTRYPWLEEAFVRALASAAPAGPVVESPGVSKFTNQGSPLAPGQDYLITNLVRNFIEILQRITAPPPAEADSYLELNSTPQTWERAHWIDGELLERDLDGVLRDACVEDSADKPRREVTQAVVRRDSPLVALVDRDRRFTGLVDRFALLAQVAAENRESS